MITEDIIKAVHKVSDTNTLESKLDYKQIYTVVTHLIYMMCLLVAIDQ